MLKRIDDWLVGVHKRMGNWLFVCSFLVGSVIGTLIYHWTSVWEWFH